jgi:hypothetical protein
MGSCQVPKTTLGKSMQRSARIAKHFHVAQNASDDRDSVMIADPRGQDISAVMLVVGRLMCFDHSISQTRVDYPLLAILWLNRQMHFEIETTLPRDHDPKSIAAPEAIGFEASPVCAAGFEFTA